MPLNQYPVNVFRFTRREFLKICTMIAMGFAAIWQTACADAPKNGRRHAKSVLKIPFENTEIALNLPEDWQILNTVRPVPRARVVDVGASLVHALDHPIGAVKSQIICEYRLLRAN